jgi:uncharacterized protein YndB with AHSA1/START domain
VSTTDDVVEQTLRIAARPEIVWLYWTDPQRMCDWWGDTAELDPRPGGAYVIEMGTGRVMRGEYVELVPHERIVFTFGWDPTEGVPDVPPGSSRVEVTLAEDDGDTILTLRHSNLPATDRGLHRAGWEQHLPHLAQAVEGDNRGNRGA